jgi:guanylate kinase
MFAELADRQRQPLMIVISGPSGVGKDTLVRRMRERGLPFHFVVTANTRPKRRGEVHGIDYIFVSRQRFEEMIAGGELIEYARVYDDFKGIPKQQVQDALASGRDVVMRIDVQGAETIRRLFPEALLIFLSTRDEEELARRLRRRKTETEEDLALRLKTARQELKRTEIFDYYVINADMQLEVAVETVLAIIHAEHHRVQPRKVAL